MENWGVNFTDDVCESCADRAINCDPHNMGWTEEEDAAWLKKWAHYTENIAGVTMTCEPEDNDPYFSRWGCPICNDGVATNLIKVTILGTGYYS